MSEPKMMTKEELDKLTPEQKLQMMKDCISNLCKELEKMCHQQMDDGQIMPSPLIQVALNLSIVQKSIQQAMGGMGDTDGDFDVPPTMN